jgi:hypothetical protein
MYHVSYWFPPVCATFSLSLLAYVCLCAILEYQYKLGVFQIITVLTQPQQLPHDSASFPAASQHDDRQRRPLPQARTLFAQGLVNMSKPDEDQSFFNRERDKLAGEIATVRAFVSCPRATSAACP